MPSHLSFCGPACECKCRDAAAEDLSLAWPFQVQDNRFNRQIAFQEPASVLSGGVVLSFARPICPTRVVVMCKHPSSYSMHLSHVSTALCTTTVLKVESELEPSRSSIVGFHPCSRKRRQNCHQYPVPSVSVQRPTSRQGYFKQVARPARVAFLEQQPEFAMHFAAAQADTSFVSTVRGTSASFLHASPGWTARRILVSAIPCRM